MHVTFLNFIALPITFGIGAEYALNVVTRYREERNVSRAVITTGAAVALCSWTTIVGYGSLLAASNQALNGFGLMAIIGEVVCLAAAIVALPALLFWRHARPFAEEPRAPTAPPRRQSTPTAKSRRRRRYDRDHQLRRLKLMPDSRRADALERLGLILHFNRRVARLARSGSNKRTRVGTGFEMNIFEHIYRNDLWHGGSGPGSFPEVNRPYVRFLQSFLLQNQIRSVVDLGCGDWQFSRGIDWGSTRYLGLDVVPHVLATESTSLRAPRGAVRRFPGRRQRRSRSRPLAHQGCVSAPLQR